VLWKQKHGTCFSANLKTAYPSSTAIANEQTRYFQALIDQFTAFPTPNIVQQAAASGQPIPLSDLQDAFGGLSKALLACKFDNGQASLYMVGICLGHDSDGNPTQQIDCPENARKSPYNNNCALSTNVAEVHVAAWNLN
jgi:hypothetical protein